MRVMRCRLAAALKIEIANVTTDGDTLEVDGKVPPGEYVEISVADTGSGMSQEVKEQAFEPFFTTKPVGAGTGLGLSMVYGFVKQSDGFISVRSEGGKGTTVSIFLPRALADEWEETTDPPVQDETGLTGQSVLVVEDDEDLRNLVASLLRDLGFQTLVAKDGRNALSLLDQNDGVDLLISDLVLPGGMSGQELAQQALERQPELKTLFMSGYIDSANSAPTTNIIWKPFRKADLARAISETLTA